MTDCHDIISSLVLHTTNKASIFTAELLPLKLSLGITKHSTHNIRNILRFSFQSLGLS